MLAEYNIIQYKIKHFKNLNEKKYSLKGRLILILTIYRVSEREKSALINIYFNKAYIWDQDINV